MRVITYDLETLKTIEEAGGWDEHDKLGVSVLCANVWNCPGGRDVDIVFSDSLPRPWPNEGHLATTGQYEMKPLAEFQQWVDDADLLVGFNSVRVRAAIAMTRLTIRMGKACFLDVLFVVSREN